MLVERADPLTAEPPKEVPEFQDHVLPRPGRLCIVRCALRPPAIVGGEKHDRESNIGVLFELFDNRAAPIRLLAENDEILLKTLEKSCRFVKRVVIVAVGEEDTMATCAWCA